MKPFGPSLTHAATSHSPATASQFTGLPAWHLPSLQVSLAVQPEPSASHAMVPALGSGTQVYPACCVGSTIQVASLQASETELQSAVTPDLQAPFWQVSPTVQGRPSSHWVPLTSSVVLHEPLVGSQMFFWQAVSLVPSQTTLSGSG